MLRPVLRPYVLLAFILLVALLSDVPAPFAAISGQQATNDTTSVYYRFQYTGTPSFFRVYIDTDRASSTGFATGGISANYLLENGRLYRHAGGGWNWTFVQSVPYSNTSSTVSWTVARTDIGETANPNDADLIFQVEAPLESSAKYTHAYSGSNSTTVTYTPTTAIFANPERGFYHHTGDCDSANFDAATLRGYRTNEGISLVMCIFYLSSFKNSPISQAAMDTLQNQLNTVRKAGLKAIVRFAYTASESGDDANKNRILGHLDQLTPYLQNNSDVIYVVQAGFVGAWGEWYYTQNFGNEGTLSSTDWANRKAVVDKLLRVLPSSRMLQLRTPKFKRTMYGSAALTRSQAYNDLARARIGHHNDCFLASSDDFGTYEDPVVEYPYLEAETKYLPMGGETCAPNPPRSDCLTALNELRGFHWAYLNTDYRSEVINGWQSGGCLSDIKRKLGYRFVLQQGTFPNSVQRGGELNVNITIKNDGWAAPFNLRQVELILRHTSTGGLYRFSLSSDPRFWLAGTTNTINQSVTLPARLPAGSYALFLNLPDPAASLANRPEYAIRMANVSVWEATSGFNRLRHTITVTN